MLTLPMGVAPASSMRCTQVAVKVELVVLEHLGGAGGAGAHEVHVVLEGHRNAREGPKGLARGAGGVGLGGGGQGEVGGDLQEGLDLRLAGVDGVKGGTSHVGGAEVAGGDACGRWAAERVSRFAVRGLPLGAEDGRHAEVAVAGRASV